jgi:hypothetical protein
VETKTSYYFWRSTYTLDSLETTAVTQREALYVKVCDVVPDGTDAVKPIAVTIWQDKPIPEKRYTPVIFIDKNIFIGGTNSDTISIETLAADIFNLIETSWAYPKLPFDEIQIDCDWTDLSREQYFLFLDVLKKKSKKKISATLRLDQIKNFQKTGVPPVDQGVVMAYNMGNLSNPNAENSILNMNVLKRYINSNTSYPLPAKLALPIFSWKLLFQENKFRGILREFPDALLKTNFKKNTETNYRCQTSFEYNGRVFSPGDIIRVEECTQEELKEAENYLRKHMNLIDETIYFDLSTQNLSRYE